jgi:hypothetical protein
MRLFFAHRLALPCAILAFLSLATLSPVCAGYIVAVGDVTPLLSIENAGNARFFSNVLGDGTHVLIHGGAAFGDPVRSYFDSVPGVTTRRTDQNHGDLAQRDFDRLDLLILVSPRFFFVDAEVDLVRDFLRRGGSLISIVEDGFTPEPNRVLNVMNQFMDELGSELKFIPGRQYINVPAVGPSRVMPHRLTEGVTTFLYSAAHRITGGEPLLLLTNGQPFASAELTVPEPATISLTAFVAVGFLVIRRRNRPLSTPA